MKHNPAIDALMLQLYRSEAAALKYEKGAEDAGLVCQQMSDAAAGERETISAIHALAAAGGFTGELRAAMMDFEHNGGPVLQFNLQGKSLLAQLETEQ